MHKKKLIWYIYVLISILVCFEIALRIVGAKPFLQKDYHITSIPSHPYIGDDTMGIILNPGTYTLTLNKKHSFKATHNNLHHRKVYFSSSSKDTLPIVATMGCSFTYGYGVNDNEHFTSLLQQRYPNFRFVNYGVIGYGTTHSYLQLLQLEQQNIFPNIVILNFASDHFNRNVLTSTYRRALKIGFNRSLESVRSTMQKSRYPYIINKELQLAYMPWDSIYTDWNGRELFSTINWLQTNKDKIMDYSKDPVNLSFLLIKKIKQICHRNNSTILVALLDESNEMEQLKTLLRKENVNLVEIGFDFNNHRYTNYPYDDHPNSLGHKRIARKIEFPLKHILQNE